MTTLHELHILYTQDLGGDLARLPRLYTYLRQLRAEQPAPPLLLDLGGSCKPGIWHCDATGGRSTLIVLDAMGYHAVNVAGMLSQEARYKLHGLITTALIDQQQSWRLHIPPVRDEGILVSAAPAPALRLCIVAAPASQARVTDRVLHLPAVQPHQVGLVAVSLGEDGAEPTVRQQAALDVPPQTRLDPTIAASVELVEEEARHYQQRGPGS